MSARPTAAPAHWPYAHPTMEEIRRLDTLPLHTPFRAKLLMDARERALLVLHVKPPLEAAA